MGARVASTSARRNALRVASKRNEACTDIIGRGKSARCEKHRLTARQDWARHNLERASLTSMWSFRGKIFECKGPHATCRTPSLPPVMRDPMRQHRALATCTFSQEKRKGANDQPSMERSVAPNRGGSDTTRDLALNCVSDSRKNLKFKKVKNSGAARFLGQRCDLENMF